MRKRVDGGVTAHSRQDLNIPRCLGICGSFGQDLGTLDVCDIFTFFITGRALATE